MGAFTSLRGTLAVETNELLTPLVLLRSLLPPNDGILESVLSVTVTTDSQQS